MPTMLFNITDFTVRYPRIYCLSLINRVNVQISAPIFEAHGVDAEDEPENRISHDNNNSYDKNLVVNNARNL